MMIRTNVLIDAKKLKEAKRAFDIQTTKELIDFALAELLRANNRKRILDLKGRIEIDLDLNQSRRIG